MSGFRIQEFQAGAAIVGPDDQVWHTTKTPGPLKKRCEMYQRAFELGRRHDTREYCRRIEAKLDPRIHVEAPR